MNEIDTTSKGNYLASINKDVISSYKKFHNFLVYKISKSFVVLLNDNQEFIGCGIFLAYLYNNRVSHFIVSAGHVISEIVKTGKIKIPINYEIINKDEEQGYVISYSISSNYSINEEEDIGIIHGNFDCEKQGYEYYYLREQDNLTNNINDDVLLFGIPWNRYRKASKKFYLNQSKNCVVNAFQLPTKIKKIDNTNIYITFPNQLYYYSPNSKIVKEGKTCDPHGLSGSTVWKYKSNDLDLSCIIIEQSDQTLKCISYVAIRNVIIKYLNKFNANNI